MSDDKIAISAKQRKETKLSRWFFICFFGLFFLVGAAMFTFTFIIPVWKIVQAQKWVETPCTITHSNVKVHDGDDGDTYSVEIHYKYEFGGKEYKSERYHFFHGSSSGKSGKQKVVQKYPRGSERICFVDPNNPESAVLYRGWSWELLIGGFALIFVAVGAGGIYFGFVGKSKGAEKKEWKPKQEFIKRDIDPFDQPTEYSNRNFGIHGIPSAADKGPVELKMEASPKTLFIGMLIFALIWNSIISIFIYQVWGEWAKGEKPWILTFFMVPFVLVGLGIIAGCGYQFLKMFNPVPKLKLSRIEIPLGESAKLNWKIGNQLSSVTRLVIRLIGKETARYQRGTDTVTDTNIFYEEDLLDTSSTYEIHEGELEIQIPPDLMHSFEGGNNDIIWQLQLKGEIQFWPDISSEYQILIAPHSEDRLKDIPSQAYDY